MRCLPTNTILLGDAGKQLRRLPSDSVDCVITSPPYFQLRKYGDPDNGQLGLEPDVDEWVAQLADVCSEIHRVLTPTGSLWLNLGDSFSRHPKYGAAPKSLLLGPEKLLLALKAAGWIVRNKVVWSKTNPMPSSVTDRLSCTWEAVYFLVKSSRYYFDLDAIRIPHLTPPTKPTRRRPDTYLPKGWLAPLSSDNNGLTRLKGRGGVGNPRGKNPGDVWPIATAGYRGAHFATFPERLVRTPLLATCPPARCSRCRTPHLTRQGNRRTGQRQTWTCTCKAPTEPGVVLDPFFGAGTVGVAAKKHERSWLGIELNRDFADLALERIGNVDTPNSKTERSAA